ncbi:transcriptional regulatory protein [Colletotrichum incanum]|nr:transcriptional regulatory protein [Colletotrichum incanum]
MDPEDGLRLQRHKQRRVADKERKRAAFIDGNCLMLTRPSCDGCRRLKEKCDGGVPCRRCTRLRRQCEFLTPTTRDEPGSETTARYILGAPFYHQDMLRSH